MTRIIRLATLLILLCTFRLTAAQTRDCANADLVIKHAHLITMDSARRTASAMAVRGERITAVGDESTVTPCIGPHTEVVDLAGKAVLPGFIDVHTHAISWAESLLRNELELGYPAVKSIADVVQAVRQRAAAAPPGQWITGFRWDDAKLAERRYITRQDLDAVSPNNPVYLEHVTGHLGVANSPALQLAGITHDTPNPDGGVIERNAAGEPTGVVKDNAMRLVTAKVPPDPPELFARAAQRASEEAAKFGLTTIHDVYSGTRPFHDEMRGYQQAYARGWLRIRVQLAPGVTNLADVEALTKIGVHTGFGDSHLKLGAVKMFSDGGMGARTIAIYPPAPEGEPTSNLGLLIWTPEDMQKAYLALAAAGWQLSTHAIGDRAINEVLDSYAATLKALNLKEPRFRIIHCGLSTPEVQRRLRDLHVLVDGDPAFVYWIGSYFARYGAERARWSYPGKSYFDNGIVVGAGSDVPVTPISPWWGLWAAVARKEVRSSAILAPEERVSVMQALEMYTRNGAYIGFEENDKGSLEPGKLADFIVVDRDVLSIPTDDLKDVRVLKTYVGGRVVYSAE